MRKNEFSVSNICGGDYRVFRLVDGDLSESARRHAKNIGYGGPAFEGPAGDAARKLWNEQEYEYFEDEE